MTIWTIPVSIIIILLFIFGLWRKKMPRAPWKEGKDSFDSIIAYDRVSHSILFYFFRFIIIRRLKIYHPRNIIADIGCGPGYLAFAVSKAFPGLRVIGIDYSVEMLRLAKRNLSRHKNNGSVLFQEADVIDLPFQNNSLDFTVSSLSLHHWQEAQQALIELYRVLKPGGQLLIFDLRRDEPLLAYYISHVLQRVLSPAPIKRINGAIGSIWASYTPPEMNALIASAPFQRWNVKNGWAWAYIWAQK